MKLSEKLTLYENMTENLIVENQNLRKKVQIYKEYFERHDEIKDTYLDECYNFVQKKLYEGYKIEPMLVFSIISFAKTLLMEIQNERRP